MTVGFNLSRITHPETRLSPADDTFAWMVVQISKMRPYNAEKVSFIEIKNKLHELYQAGYEDGREDEQNVSKKGGQ